jgi:hypothetical protein
MGKSQWKVGEEALAVRGFNLAPRRKDAEKYIEFRWGSL